MYIRPALLYNKLVYSCYHLQGLQSRKVIMAIFEKQLLQKQQHMLDEEGEHDSEEDALSRLMRSDVKNQITVETLQELGLEMLFAGHITTASSLTSLLIHLAHNRYSTSPVLTICLLSPYLICLLSIFASYVGYKYIPTIEYSYLTCFAVHCNPLTCLVTLIKC